MRHYCLLWFALAAIGVPSAVAQSGAAAVNEALGRMSPDANQTFRVRDVQFSRGDIKVYLTEGVISFLTPVSDKTVAAVFSTGAVDGGDAEIIVLPPQRNDRAALATFTKSPNLDEHFDSALFLFTDKTAEELLAAIQQSPVRKMPEVAGSMATAVHTVVENIGNDMRGRLAAGLFDRHQPEQGFFYALIGGKSLGTFDVLHSPDDFEQVTIGRSTRMQSGASSFQLWSSFRTRRSGPYVPPKPLIDAYRITADIHPDLSLAAEADFKWRASEASGRVIPLLIADKIQVDSAEIDGRAAEVFQPGTGQSPTKRAATFYLIGDGPFAAGSEHSVKVRYHGAVVRKTDTGSYFVDDRNAWYPFEHPTLATFDLTFRCPENLRLVSTGELISDKAQSGVRTVHRVTQVPEALAGFNLGEYNVTSEDHGPYRVEVYANKAAISEMEEIPQQMNALLDYYSNRWLPLPIHSVAVSPIPGFFGQGFPGLIYLSDVSYARAEDRPLNLRSQAFDQFFSDLLLPHEAAHQWWGSMVTVAEYRSEWIMEALANYSALQFVEKNRGRRAAESILDSYRADLMSDQQGKTLDSYGPLEFGGRLMDAANAKVWHTITYEKGTWVMHMLHERLGEQNFLKLQLKLLHDFADRPLTNDEFRKAAAEFVPAGEPDKNLSSFFDTWVYGTGIPKLEMKGGDVMATGVDDDFTADIPMRCRTKGDADQVRWLRVSSGSNSLDFPAGITCKLPASNEFLYVTAR